MEELWCFHCSHVCKECFAMPIQFDREKNIYTVYGNFCCIECMKAYNAHSNDSFKHNRFSLITQMYDLYSKDVKIAPPREALQCFGGTLSIEEFRKRNGDFSNLNIPPMTKLELQIDGEKNLNQISNFTWSNNTKTEEEPQAQGLMRKAPLKTQGTLEHIMGINLKK